MTVHITPVEVDGKFWITITVDGGELRRRGPFPTADETEAAAERIRAIARVLTPRA